MKLECSEAKASSLNFDKLKSSVSQCFFSPVSVPAHILEHGLSHPNAETSLRCVSIFLAKALHGFGYGACDSKNRNCCSITLVGFDLFFRPMTSVESRQCCSVAFWCEWLASGRNLAVMAHLRRQQATFRSNHSMINLNFFPMAAKRSRFSGEPIASREPSSRLTS